MFTRTTSDAMLPGSTAPASFVVSSRIPAYALEERIAGTQGNLDHFQKPCLTW